MSDAVLVAVVMSAPATIGLVLSALNNALAKRTARHLQKLADEQQRSHAAIELLEKNTNSIKDALVKVTGDEAFARGVKIGHDAATGPPGPQGETGATGPRGKSA